VITAFRTPLMLRHALFFVISQPGRSRILSRRPGRRAPRAPAPSPSSIRRHRRWLAKRSSSFRSKPAKSTTRSSHEVRMTTITITLIIVGLLYGIPAAVRTFRREMAEDENVWLVVIGIGIMVFYWV
jgi:hypothetical protein